MSRASSMRPVFSSTVARPTIAHGCPGSCRAAVWYASSASASRPRFSSAHPIAVQAGPSPAAIATASRAARSPSAY